MHPDEYRVMYEMEDAYWWYVGMRRIIFSMVEGYCSPNGRWRILDAGCGTGATLHRLGRYGDAVGIDIAPEALYFCRERGLQPRQLAQSSVTALPFPGSLFDLVTSFDVLSYLEDDRPGFRELNRVLKKGGWLLVNLPAFPFLHGGHDLAVGTKRRFTRPTLCRRMEEAGFRVIKLSYVNSLLFPAVAAVRLWKRGARPKSARAQSDLTPLPPLLNGALAAVLFAEAALLRAIDFPFGVSVMGLGQKMAEVGSNAGA